MRALHRKVLRDARHLRGQLLGIAVLVACGIAIFVMLRSMNGYLRGSLDRYYADYHFGEVFARVSRAPLSLEPRIAALPGVQAVETRIVHEVLLDVPGLAEPATGRVVSIPDGAGPRLNRLHLRTGHLPDAGRRDQVVLSDAFARANGLRVGDQLRAALNGRWLRMTVVGTAISPEFVYELSGAGGMFPDNRRYGAVWINRSALAGAFDMEGAFNDLVVALAPRASEPAAIEAVDRLLEPYGNPGAYGRAQHVSHQFVSSEIDETEITSVFFPALFLLVTAFLLNTTLLRLVRTEREQIGLLRAFGFPATAIAAHYVQLGMIPVVTGSLVGGVGGVWLAGGMAGVYARFFQFPEIAFQLEPRVLAWAFGIATATGVLGALASARGAIRLAPAVAMAPPAPAGFRHGIWEGSRIWRRLAPAFRIIVRNISRTRWKSLSTVSGVGLSLAVLIALLSVFDAIDVIADVQFDHAAREDMAVVFDRARSPAVLADLARLPGVLAVEALRAVPVRLVHGHRERRTALTGIAAGAELRRVVDADLRAHAPPAAGLLLSHAMARRLDAVPGDRVRVEVTEGERRIRDLVVAGVIGELMGAGAYLEAAALDELAGSSTAIGAVLRVDPAGSAALYAELKTLPGIAGVTVREVVMRGFMETIEESFMIALTTTMVLGSTLVMAIVYNQTRIALSERGRELASLRVLGFSRGEVTRMLLGEQGLLVAAAIPLGLVLGWLLTLVMMVRFESDLFRLPVVVNPGTYALATGMVLVAATLSALLVWRRLHRMDLIAVLKTRE